MKQLTVDEPKQIQLALFERIRLGLHPDESLVDVISEVLELSDDSSYRRIRGEKLLRFEELRKLALHFRFSLDETLLGDTHGMFFEYKSVRRSNLDFKVYYTELAETIERISRAPNAHMLYAAWDVPIFHYFEFPMLMLFKTFFWRRTVWNDPSMEGVDFKLDKLMNELGPALSEEGDRVVNAYISFPSTEVWHRWTLESTLKQIEFCVESGFFVHDGDAERLLEELYRMVEHVEDQAKSGYKFRYGRKPEMKVPNFKLYMNEVFFLNNTIIATGDNLREVYVVHESVNFMHTTNPKFCQETAEWMEAQTRKSDLLTNSSERLRNKFFKGLYAEIEEIMAKI
jgi:hypothetical protein